MTTQPAQAPARKVRCRLLDHKLNRCANESLSEDGLALCASHLAKAYQDYVRLTGGKVTLITGKDKP